MTGSEHINQVAQRVHAERKRLSELRSPSTSGRHICIWDYAANVKLQVLYTKQKRGTPDFVEVGLAFDHMVPSTNVDNVSAYRAQMGKAERELALSLREGLGGRARYLTHQFPLDGDVSTAYDKAAQLVLKILDLRLGGDGVRKLYDMWHPVGKK